MTDGPQMTDRERALASKLDMAQAMITELETRLYGLESSPDSSTLGRIATAHELTPRQAAVLGHRLEGLTDKDVGSRLGITAEAVRATAARAQRRIKARQGRAGLMRWVWRRLQRAEGRT